MKKNRNKYKTAMELGLHAVTLIIFCITYILLYTEAVSFALESIFYITPCLMDSIRFLAKEKSEYNNSAITVMHVIAFIVAVVAIILGFVSLVGAYDVRVVFYILLPVYPLKEAFLVAFYLVLSLKKS